MMCRTPRPQPPSANRAALRPAANRAALGRAGWTVALAAVLAVAGCAGRVTGPTAGRTGAETTATPSVPAPTTAPAPPVVPLAGRAPAQAYPVGVRTLAVANGPGRPLPTTLYYPAAGRAGATPRPGAAPAAGHFPVVVFSHGLTASPVTYQALLARWAAAGFVVAAPAYPHTSTGVAKFDVLDVVNQPADASHVLTAVLALDAAPTDPLHGRLDTAHVAAAGHSAGGITTVGLFTARRDARLLAGIVLAGSALGFGTVYSGPPASMLFVHGGRDDVVSYSDGKATYDQVPWAKALFTLPQDGHGTAYLRGETFTAVAAVTTDFLRLALYGDQAARQRLAREAGRVGTLDDRL